MSKVQSEGPSCDLRGFSIKKEYIVRFRVLGIQGQGYDGSGIE